MEGGSPRSSQEQCRYSFDGWREESPPLPNLAPRFLHTITFSTIRMTELSYDTVVRAARQAA